MEVSTWRRRPRVMTMRGGGAEGGCGREALTCAQASQWGLLVRPAKGFGSRRRLGRGGMGSSVVGQAVAGSLGHIQWSMTHSHTRATSTNWKKKSGGTMATPPHTRGKMRILYPVCQVAELAAS